MRSFEQLKAWEEIVISSDDEEALLKQIAVSNMSVGLAPQGEKREMSRWLTGKF